MKKTILICFMTLFSSVLLSAETERGQISYSGSRGDQNISLNTEVLKTEYRWVQVAYQQRVCRTETRYRRECRQEAPRRVCRTVNKPQCRIERQCRRDRNGNQVCHRVRVCRDRQVRVCRDEPGRRVCRQVPYQERVCRMETRYRQERRAYQVVDSRTNANLRFSFTPVGDSSGIRTEIDAVLNREFLSIQTEDFSSPKRALVFNLNEDSRRSGRDLILNKTYSIKLKKADDLFAPINQEISASEINGGLVSFTIGQVNFPENTEFLLRVTSGSVLMDRMLTPSEFTLIKTQGLTLVSLNLGLLLNADYSGRELGVELKVRINQNLILNKTQFSRFERAREFSRIWH
jgi:hypothetical protein